MDPTDQTAMAPDDAPHRHKDPRGGPGNFVALVRLAFPLVAILALMLPTPYARLDELHAYFFVAHGDAPPSWRETSDLTFWQTVDRQPNEVWWLCLPLLAIALIVWERIEARRRRRRGRRPSVAGPVARMVIFLVATLSIAVVTFRLDLFDKWTPGAGKVALFACGLTMFLGLVAEIALAAGRRPLDARAPLPRARVVS